MATDIEKNKTGFRGNWDTVLETCHGRTRPNGIRMGLRMETGFLVLVIPGLDPGIALTDGVRGDPRITSGDDEKGRCVRPDVSPSRPYPDACADPPGHDRRVTARRENRIRLSRLARRVELLDRLRIQFDFRSLHELRKLL
jgi:hypothetical protein